jgi:hypothetical protein
MSSAHNPVHLEARLDERLSRGLWLVKWLLVIPHVIVLVFLWMAFAVLTVLAFFAILFTGRYPRGIFDFNVGVMRWTWRVAYYSYGALGTDHYPPFSLDEVEDYPTHLNIDYPERLSRGLVLVKWWLLAIPHFLVLSAFSGGSLWWRDESSKSGWHVQSYPGLLAILVIVAAVVLLFTASYPRHIFDFVIGISRWSMRVYAYTALMTDVYPPFRLDQGGEDPDRSPALGTSESAAAGLEPPGAPLAAPPTATRWTAGRIVAAVFASVSLLTSLALVIGGGAVALADQGLRDNDGFLMSRGQSFASASYAITSQSVELHTSSQADWVPRQLLGDVKLKASAPAGSTIFLGIAKTTDVDSYLNGVSHATVTQITSGRSPAYTEVLGGAPSAAPEELGIWDAQASGSGTVELRWTPQSGDWTVVMMNADASAGVSASLAAGATLPVLSAVWVTLFVLAGLAFLLGVALMLFALMRTSRRP